MNKILGVVIIVLALAIGIVPALTDCMSQGKMLTTAAGTTVPMKCHWTAMAAIGVAIPLALIGIMNLVSKRKETLRSLNLVGASLGAMAVLFPTVLIGVCANSMMYCNMIEKPTLIFGGTLAAVACLITLANSQRMVELTA